MSLCISYHFVILAQHQSWMNSVIMTHVKNDMPIVSNTVQQITTAVTQLTATGI